MYVVRAAAAAAAAASIRAAVNNRGQRFSLMLQAVSIRRNSREPMADHANSLMTNRITVFSGSLSIW
jgi:hypothetical protein